MTNEMSFKEQVNEAVRLEKRRRRRNLAAAVGVPILVLSGVAYAIIDDIRSMYREGRESRAEWSQKHEAWKEKLRAEYQNIPKDMGKHKHIYLGNSPNALETITLESNPHYDFEVLHRDTIGRDSTRKYKINGREVSLVALGGDDFFEPDEDGSVKGRVRVTQEHGRGCRSQRWFSPKQGGLVTHVADGSNGKRLDIIVHSINPKTGEFSYTLVRSALVR